MFDKILVGVDGRQGSRDAIAPARQLAAPARAALDAKPCQLDAA
jgi:nucleotide-binding universal stress UspA family protein